jgi:hypothetical protein
MYFQYTNNVNAKYAVPTAIIDLLCLSLVHGFCTVKQSMLRRPKHSKNEVVAPKEEEEEKTMHEYY